MTTIYKLNKLISTAKTLKTQRANLTASVIFHSLHGNVQNDAVLYSMLTGEKKLAGVSFDKKNKVFSFDKERALDTCIALNIDFQPTEEVFIKAYDEYLSNKAKPVKKTDDEKRALVVSSLEREFKKAQNLGMSLAEITALFSKTAQK